MDVGVARLHLASPWRRSRPSASAPRRRCRDRRAACRRPRCARIGKSAPDGLDVVGRRKGCVHRLTCLARFGSASGPRPQPASTMPTSASRAPSCSTASSASPRKAWTRRLSASACGRPRAAGRTGGPRRAGRRGAVGALHVVGEDLELRLVVHRAALREEERRRHHAPVGLLGVGLDDDLALEHARRVAVDDGLEQLAALAVRRRMVDHQGRVRVLARP